MCTTRHVRPYVLIICHHLTHPLHTGQQMQGTQVRPWLAGIQQAIAGSGSCCPNIRTHQQQPLSRPLQRQLRRVTELTDAYLLLHTTVRTYYVGTFVLRWNAPSECATCGLPERTFPKAAWPHEPLPCAESWWVYSGMAHALLPSNGTCPSHRPAIAAPSTSHPTETHHTHPHTRM